ncbi:hypothetical protein Hanom_Chr07g00624191 [Helianthus anomalus]
MLPIPFSLIPSSSLYKEIYKRTDIQIIPSLSLSKTASVGTTTNDDDWPSRRCGGGATVGSGGGGGGDHFTTQKLTFPTILDLPNTLAVTIFGDTKPVGIRRDSGEATANFLAKTFSSFHSVRV